MNQQSFLVLMGGVDSAIGYGCTGQQCKDGLTALVAEWMISSALLVRHGEILSHMKVAQMHYSCTRATLYTSGY